MVERQIKLVNLLGLHARAASKLVQLAQEFAARISIVKGEQVANGKSIMSIMMLQATAGTVLELRVEGEDELVAIEAIVALIEDKFGETD